jgi:CubicO group peptidase (beta-lactamase class C family)
LLRAIASTYFGRYVLFNRPTSEDHARLPQRHLAPSPTPIALARTNDPAPLDQLLLTVRPETGPVTLPTLLAQTGTTAFVVLVKGRCAWEHYANGGRIERPHRCFSVTKSVASALVGLAVGSGAIDSLESPIGRWLPELGDSRARELTLAHLLEMRSGIGFIEGLLPWDDEPRTYYGAHMRRALRGCKVRDPVGAFFHYNDWHPLLVSLLLERATGMSVTEWLQKRLWNPLGAEEPASMMVDCDGADAVEHLESGLTSTARDLAKFGQLYLQRGLWQGQRLLPDGWVEASTSPNAVRIDSEWFRYYRRRPWGRFLSSGRIYYKRFWWGHRLDADRHDFFAMGVLGQHIYVSPDLRAVVVRLSARFPPGIWWAPLLRKVAEAAAASQTSQGESTQGIG